MRDFKQNSILQNSVEDPLFKTEACTYVIQNENTTSKCCNALHLSEIWVYKIIWNVLQKQYLIESLTEINSSKLPSSFSFLLLISAQIGHSFHIKDKSWWLIQLVLFLLTKWVWVWICFYFFCKLYHCSYRRRILLYVRNSISSSFLNEHKPTDKYEHGLLNHLLLI